MLGFLLNLKTIAKKVHLAKFRERRKMQKYAAFFMSIALLTGCKTTQDISIETKTKVSANVVNTSTTVRIREIAISNSNTAETDSSKTTLIETKTGTQPKQAVTKPVKLNPKVDASNLTAVSDYCENFAYEAVYIKENCKSAVERKICSSAQFGNAIFMKEFNYCIVQYGWETY